MDKETRSDLIGIIISGVLLVTVYIVDTVFSLPLWGSLLLYLIPYLAAGHETLMEAGENILHGEIFDENFLMALSTIGALFIGFLPGAEPQFAEAVFVMLFFRVGEMLEHIAEGKSRKSIAALMDMRPDCAHVERRGETITVAPEEVLPGEVILIRPGEKVPMDGVVLDGVSSLNTVALTGESVPRDVETGSTVISGCVNLSGVLRVKVSKPFGESTAMKILDLVENAGEKKSKSENFITKFARYYTPTVIGCALLLAVLPPLFSGDFLSNLSSWLYRSLSFLVISCPCALVISVPLTFFCGIGRASKRGILIKGSQYMETLTKVDTVVFDKTGTLTHGVFEVTAVHPHTCDETHLLHLAAHVERYSTHPIALSLRQAYGNEDDNCEVSNVHETAGEGICARVNGHEVWVGNEKLMKRIGVSWKPCHHTGTIIHVVIDHEYAGHIVISDTIKKTAPATISRLKESGVSRTVMLTGDCADVGREAAEALGIDEYHAELLPADKVGYVERLLAEKHGNGAVAFVGDGINDAPVLARADIGIAMGALGSEAAIEAADVVLMDDDPEKIAEARQIAGHTLFIVRQNIVLTLAIKFTVLILAAFNCAPMWLAVFADVGVTFLAIVNAMRVMK